MVRKMMRGEKIMTNKESPNIIMGVIGSDSHAIGNKLLNYALKEAGFNTINLGSFVSQEDFINAAIESDARVILVSSLYGHAETDAEGFKDKIIEAGLDVILYIGGRLSVGKSSWKETKKRFKEMGFDRVAPPKTTPDDVIEWLKKDLEV